MCVQQPHIGVCFIVPLPAGKQAGTAQAGPDGAIKANDAAQLQVKIGTRHDFHADSDDDEAGGSDAHGSISGSHGFKSSEPEYDAEYYLDGERDEENPTAKIGSKKIVKHPAHGGNDPVVVPAGKPGKRGRDGADGKVRGVLAGKLKVEKTAGCAVQCSTLKHSTTQCSTM